MAGSAERPRFEIQSLASGDPIPEARIAAAKFKEAAKLGMLSDVDRDTLENAAVVIGAGQDILRKLGIQMGREVVAPSRRRWWQRRLEEAHQKPERYTYKGKEILPIMEGESSVPSDTGWSISNRKKQDSMKPPVRIYEKTLEKGKNVLVVVTSNGLGEYQTYYTHIQIKTFRRNSGVVEPLFVIGKNNTIYEQDYHFKKIQAYRVEVLQDGDGRLTSEIHLQKGNLDFILEAQTTALKDVVGIRLFRQ
jgi:hypothetical protein